MRSRETIANTLVVRTCHRLRLHVNWAAFRRRELQRSSSRSGFVHLQPYPSVNVQPNRRQPPAFPQHCHGCHDTAGMDFFGLCRILVPHVKHETLLHTQGSHMYRRMKGVGVPLPPRRDDNSVLLRCTRITTFNPGCPEFSIQPP